MVLTRVGILGGTFDPVHRGHIEIARHAIRDACLDRVIFIPAGQPRLKSAAPTASVRHRLEMLRLAVRGMAGFEVSELELEGEGPTQTVDTLRAMRCSLGSEVELYFILGLDVLEKFDQWVEPAGVAELATLLAVSRPGYTAFDWGDFYAKNPYAKGGVAGIESTAIDISASELRRRLAEGAPVEGLLPEGVEEYIRANGLYSH